MKIQLQNKPPKNVAWSVIKSPAGRLVIGISEKGAVCRSTILGQRQAADVIVEWQTEWQRTVFAAGAPPPNPFALPILLIGTTFQQKVWAQTLKIPMGKVMSYGEVASRVGVPRAARAVGMACGVCPLFYIVPLHRVVGSNGLGGFGNSGRENKRQMLKKEGVHYAPVKIKAAKLYGQRVNQEDVYRRFLDMYGVQQRGRKQNDKQQ